MIEEAEFVNVNGASITFNDNEVPFHSFSTEVEIRTEVREKAREHGLWPSYQYLGGRRFVAEGDILTPIGEYMVKRVQLIRAFMPSGQRYTGTLRIRYTGINDILESKCVLDGWPELPMEALSPNRGTYMITLLAFDPRLFGTTEFSANTIAPATSVGREYDKTYTYTYIVPGGGVDDLILTNIGNIETYPTVEVIGPAEDPLLTLVRPTAGNLEVRFSNFNVPAGQSLMINFANRTAVTTSGVNAFPFLSSNSVWWALSPGDNQVNFKGYFTSSPSQAIFRWQNAYMI